MSHNTLADDEIVDMITMNFIPETQPLAPTPNLLLTGHIHPQIQPPFETEDQSYSPSSIIKFGLYITDEAQEPPTSLEVFERDGVGYMVMEYTRGGHLDFNDEEEVEWLVTKVMEIVKYFWRLKGGVVGAIGGGRCRGYWWSSDFPKFDSVGGLEEWVRMILPLKERSGWGLYAKDMVFCHMDLASRNILIIEGEYGAKEVAVVDWERAGWFPRVFEVARLEMVVCSRLGGTNGLGGSNGSMKEMEFERKLLEKLRGVLGLEEVEMIAGV
ncbi:hypothetical protein TWF506_009365 [Arthrobotrys conoides]|uniref:Aminoglycoside phosphotransferase domain-containing protein n=1 Tax=Arthrobotrys conoides TaxID=74498 RepID=A0AAN8NCC8_9PEZI